MPWPTKLAYKVVAQFFSMEYSESARRLLLDDLKIKEMIFYNQSATPEARKVTAFRVAAELLKHMDELSIDLEPEGNQVVAMNELSAVLADGERESEQIGAVIDAHFSFIDE